MRDEPGALKCRHQSLVVNLRLKEIEKNEYSRKDCREGQYPSILPADISEQTCAGCKERIPQPRFTHGAEWRTLQRYPEKNDKARKNYGRCPGCQQGRLSVVKRRSGRSRNRQQYCQGGKINEYIPSHHFTGPLINNMNAPARSISIPARAKYLHGSRTICKIQ